MGIMTGRARGPFIYDMLSVPGETLIGQDAGAIVTLVAQRVGKSAFRRSIRCRIIALQQGLIDRTVRAFCTNAARARAFVATVAVGAIDLTVGRKG